MRTHRTTLQTRKKIGRSTQAERHSTTNELRIGRNEIKLGSSKELGCVSSRRPLVSPGHAARGARHRLFKHVGQLRDPSEFRWRPVQTSLCPAQLQRAHVPENTHTADYQVRVGARPPRIRGDGDAAVGDEPQAFCSVSPCPFVRETRVPSDALCSKGKEAVALLCKQN
jgi:hypothetical protein